MNEDSPCAMYSFTHRQIILLSAVYSLSNVRTEIWSSKCLCTISDFCSGVHTRFFCPFRTVSTSAIILAQRKGRQHGGFPCVYLYLTPSTRRWFRIDNRRAAALRYLWDFFDSLRAAPLRVRRFLYPQQPPVRFPDPCNALRKQTGQ